MAPQRVLLNGASSLVGYHVLEELISRDVTICAVVNNSRQAAALRQKHPDVLSSRLNIVVVNDFLNLDAYKEALSASSDRFDSVIHSPTIAPPREQPGRCVDILRLIEKTNRTLLDFASDCAPNARRAVIVNSSSTIAEVAAAIIKTPKIDSPMSILGSPGEEETVLSVCWEGMKLLEDWTCDYMSAKRPRFDLVSLASPVLYGPQSLPARSAEEVEEGNSRIWRYVHDPRESNLFHQDGLAHYADARDVAFAAVQALFIPSAGNKHLSICAGVLSPRKFCYIISSRFPQLGTVPEEGERTLRRPGSPSRNYPTMFDSTEAATTLGLVKYIAAEETLADTVSQLLQSEQSTRQETPS